MRARAPLGAALIAAMVLSWMIGVAGCAGMFLPSALSHHAGADRFGGMGVVAALTSVIGLPGAIFGVLVIGWPAHIQLARLRPGLPAYAMAGLGGGVAVTAITALLWTPSGVVALTGLAALPGASAGLAAAVTLWWLRRPDIWRTP